MDCRHDAQKQAPISDLLPATCALEAGESPRHLVGVFCIFLEDDVDYSPTSPHTSSKQPLATHPSDCWRPQQHTTIPRYVYVGGRVVKKSRGRPSCASLPLRPAADMLVAGCHAEKKKASESHSWTGEW